MGRRSTERRKIKTDYALISQLYFDKKYDTFISEATKYLQVHQNDIEMRFMRAKAYRKLNYFDEAIKDLKYILEIKVNNYALAELYFIYYYLNMYVEAIKLLPLVYETRCISAYSAYISELIMKKKLGISMKFKKGNKCDYITSQVTNYTVKEALNHITTNHSIIGDNGEANKEKSYFNDNINLEYLFQIIRSSIKNSKKVNKDEILEVHYFAVANVGVYNDNNCNFIKVIVIPNTNNIITMYPTNSIDDGNVSNLEFDGDLLFNKKQKIKTMSQIDKFNKRYGRV